MQVLALKPDCISYFGSGVENFEAGLTTVCRILEAGINVVSTTFSSIAHPKFVDPAIAKRINEACVKGNVSFFTTGVEPGFASDLLPMAVLAAADRIDSVTIYEIANYGAYPDPTQIRDIMGLGLAYDKEPIFAQGDLITRAFGGTVQEIAAAIGVKLDGLRQWIEYAPLPHDIETASGVHKAGTRGALRAACDGMYGGKPIVTLMHVNYLFLDFPADWRRAKLGDHTVYRTELVGRPNMVLEACYDLEGKVETAVIATAMRAINSIPAVVAAKPGQLDGLDVPAIHGGHIRARV